MPKSKVRKKNGKKVKYTPKPQGISKTKMKKLMEMIAEQQKLMEAQQGGSAETGEGVLSISDEFSKKINVTPSDQIKEEGPSLSVLEENSQEETGN
jgi:hypothetical protein